MGKSPRNPACTGLVFQSITLSLILWSLPLVALSAFYLSVSPLLQGLSTFSASTTLGASEDIKDHFYVELDSLIGKIPKVEPLILLGDLNARVSSDHQSWPSCIGHHGTGRMNDNGQRLLELCSFQSLCVTNTFFQLKHQHKVSWKHTRSHKWHQQEPRHCHMLCSEKCPSNT